ncbi:MAG: hypothetical protein CSA26_01495 [Desulfobacterales bacterium]|nr:MAG: hypothetical protein CSA26_01495 [Desulfobacterales bacterium]
MEIASYRIVKQRHVASAFDGEGARRNGGRWNSSGIPLVYTSESLALCCLEIFVHLPSYKLLQEYVYIVVQFDSDLVTDAEISKGWDSRPVSRSSQSIGNQWVRDGKSPVLKVPSVIIPDGSNYLLNVGHPDFSKIRIGEPMPMSFDPRLLKG